jgi:hypothetical protein
MKRGLEKLRLPSELCVEGEGGRGRKNLSELRSFRHWFSAEQLSQWYAENIVNDNKGLWMDNNFAILGMIIQSIRCESIFVK